MIVICNTNGEEEHERERDMSSCRPVIAHVLFIPTPLRSLEHAHSRPQSLHFILKRVTLGTRMKHGWVQAVVRRQKQLSASAVGCRGIFLHGVWRAEDYD